MSIDHDHGPKESNVNQPENFPVNPPRENRDEWNTLDNKSTTWPQPAPEQADIKPEKKNKFSRRRLLTLGVAAVTAVTGVAVYLGIGSNNSNAGAERPQDKTTSSESEVPTYELPPLTEKLTPETFTFTVKDENGEYQDYKGIEKLKEKYGVRKEVYTQDSENPARASEEPFRELIDTVNMITNYDASTPEQEAVIEDYKSENYSAEILQNDYVTPWMMDGLLFDKSESENGTKGIYAEVFDNVQEIMEKRKSDDSVRYTYEGTMWSGQQGTPGVGGSMTFEDARISVNLKKESEDGETNVKKHWTMDVEIDEDGRYYTYKNTSEDDLL